MPSGGLEAGCSSGSSAGCSTPSSGGQLAGLVHLQDDVAATHQLAVDEELRDRRPVRDRRELLADPRVGEDVERGVLDLERVERGGRAHREAAGRLVGGALHEEHHGVVLGSPPPGKSGSRRWSSGSSWSRSLEREGVDRAAHLVAEDVVDELVLVDPGEPVEAVRDDLGAEVVAAPGQVLDLASAPGIASSMRVLSSSAVGIQAVDGSYYNL